MANVRGRYISLSSSSERRIRLKQHLQKFGLSQHYSCFHAIRGDAQAAASRGLRAGEWGLWQSWLQLLEKELSRPYLDYDWLHIVEDDVELSRHFLMFCQKLKPEPPSFDMLFTDMYVNPSVYRALSEEHQQLQEKGEIHFKTDVYTGCTASVLIHRERIAAVLNCLRNCIRGDQQILPLDNQLRRMIHQKSLRFARTAPFITGVTLNSISNSTIQESERAHQSVTLTQQICMNLRHQLSTLNHTQTTEELISLIQDLARADKREGRKDATRSITLSLIDLAEKYDLLRYNLQARLLGEPNNPQQFQ